MKSLHVLLVSLFALQTLLFASTPAEATRFLRLSLGYGATRQPSWAPSLKVSLIKPPRPRHLPPPPPPRHLPPPPPSPDYHPEPGPGLGSNPRPILVVPAANSESPSYNKFSELNPSVASA